MKKIIIVGGGTAGWLTAAILASRYKNSQSSGLPDETCVEITLIESPDVQTVGVGEGTWPSMRSTLQSIGISESDFIRSCDVSLKQGTRFNGWLAGGQEYYYHPFSLPAGFGKINLVDYWQPVREEISFAEAVTSQARVCDMSLSAKKISVPEFAFNLNYGYHLDAGKFAKLLKTHCCLELGVGHVVDHVTCVSNDDDGYIQSLGCKETGTIKGDLFVDCTGFTARIIGDHYSVPVQDLSAVLFNNRALATQVAYPSKIDPVIPSATLSCAQETGWIWDIGLASRRGVGLVYSDEHASEEQAIKILQDYLMLSLSKTELNNVSMRSLAFKPGYRKQVWYKNCVAIGLSAGFVEPLEASALVLVETSAKLLADNLPTNREEMTVRAAQMNDKLCYHWRQIIDFLKLHYVLSKRESKYWCDHRCSESIPESLQSSLVAWKYQAPNQFDAPRIDELFSSASFQYVLYGMGWQTNTKRFEARDDANQSMLANEYFKQIHNNTKQLLESLPSNIELSKKIHEFGLQKV